MNGDSGPLGGQARVVTGTGEDVGRENAREVGEHRANALGDRSSKPVLDAVVADIQGGTPGRTLAGTDGAAW